MTTIYYVSLDREHAIEAYMWENDPENTENGHREINIFPKQIVSSGKGDSPDNPYHVKLIYVQDGCSYGPEITNNMYSSFSTDDLFVEEDGCEFAYDEIRADARKHYAEENDLDIDEVDERRLDKNYVHYDAIEKIETDWVTVAASYNRDALNNSAVDELVDEEKDIVYKICWIE